MVPDDPTPDDIDEPEAELLPDDPGADLDTEPDPPRVPDTAANDVDPELRKQFWTVVLLFNVGIFGVSLGLMLIGFEGRWTFGGGLLLVGLVALSRGWAGYQRATDTSWSDADDQEEDDEGGDESEDDERSPGEDGPNDAEVRKD